MGLIKVVENFGPKRLASALGRKRPFYVGGPGIHPGKFYRSKGGIWLGDVFAPEFNVLAVLKGPLGIRYALGINIVTDLGDKYYAQKAAGEAETDDFDGNANRGGEMGTSATAPAKTDKGCNTPSAATGHKQTQNTGYPKTNDVDADNTGGGLDIVTWLHDWAKTEGNQASIAEFAIGIDVDVDGDLSNDGPSTDKALMHATLTSFTKTSNDTLKIFSNHTFNGV